MRQAKQAGTGGGGSGGGGGPSAADATNPNAANTQYQVQNTFIPSTYEADGFAHSLGLLMVKPFKTKSDFFPSWITRTTLPVATTADPHGNEPTYQMNSAKDQHPSGELSSVFRY